MVLVHDGGERREIEPYDATEDGHLWVRWDFAGVYVVRLFSRGRAKDVPPPGRLYTGPRARTPLLWRVESLEVARADWRARTGKLGPAAWERVWKDGRLAYIKVDVGANDVFDVKEKVLALKK